MNLKNNFLLFLKSEQNKKATLHQCCFRFLQWQYDENRKLKSGIIIEQGDKPAFNASVTIEDRTFYFHQTIEEIINAIENK